MEKEGRAARRPGWNNGPEDVLNLARDLPEGIPGEVGVMVLPEDVLPNERKGAVDFFFFLNSLNFRAVFAVLSLRSVSSNS